MRVHRNLHNARRGGPQWIETKGGRKVAEHRALLLAHESVRVICMTRDSRDVIVSAYYHDWRKQRVDGSFAQYYWQEGRTILPKLMRYQSTWAAPHAQMTATSFEALKTDFQGEVARIAGLLGLSPDATTLERIRDETSLESLREKYQDASSGRRPVG